MSQNPSKIANFDAVDTSNINSDEKPNPLTTNATMGGSQTQISNSVETYATSKDNINSYKDGNHNDNNETPASASILNTSDDLVNSQDTDNDVLDNNENDNERLI